MGKIILDIHDMLLIEHGGLSGIRDENLLNSSEMAPVQFYHYSNPKPSIIELGARYAYSMTKNHPFIDGNKRTAFMTMGIFLEDNGFELTASEEESYLIMIDLAANVMGEKELIEWLKENTQKV